MREWSDGVIENRGMSLPRRDTRQPALHKGQAVSINATPLNLAAAASVRLSKLQTAIAQYPLTSIAYRLLPIACVSAHRDHRHALVVFVARDAVRARVQDRLAIDH